MNSDHSSPRRGHLSGALLPAAAAGVGGAAFAQLILFPGFAAQRYDMEGIPLLFALILCIPLLTGIAAALGAPRAPYAAAVLASVVLVIVGPMLEPVRDAVIPLIARDVDHVMADLRGYHLVPPDLLFFLPAAFWAGFLAHPGLPFSLASLRDATVPFAFGLSVLALFPATTYWLPGGLGWILALIAPAALFAWVIVRGRLRARPAPQEDV